jgi:hypothetical protein
MEGNAPDDLLTAGLTYPNQLFLLDSTGLPLNGFYTQSGVRCGYRDIVTKAPLQLSAQDQLGLFRTAIGNLRVPLGAAPAEVDPMCCNMVIFGLERTCPVNNFVGAVQVATTDGVTRRCTAAKQMKIDMAVVDLCDPALVKRERFRIATTWSGEDPTRASVFPSEAIKIEDLVAKFYPVVGPPACPSSIFYKVPWTSGMCRITGETYP